MKLYYEFHMGSLSDNSIKWDFVKKGEMEFFISISILYATNASVKINE